MAKKQSKDNLNQEHEQQLAELTADLQRNQADFVNYKRRAEEDQRRAVSIGREGTIAALLPTVDNIQRALEHAPDDIKNHEYVKAIQSVAKQLDKTLIEMGVTRFQTVGEEFNPETMEAVMMEDGDGEKEIVIEEMQSGYSMNGAIIRHAMVKVGKP